jgi:hypothetical protein
MKDGHTYAIRGVDLVVPIIGLVGGELRNVLQVPSLTRNLLSVPKLNLYNNVLCEFHLFDLFIKDRATH